MNLQIECYSSTHVGLKRSNNQDSILVNKDINIFSVADGLGGHLGGEVASALAVGSFNDFVKEYSSQSSKKPQWIIEHAFQKANKDIFDQSQKHDLLRGMGTTLSVLWINKNKVYIGHIGDSRVYLYRENNLWQLTDDHTLLAHQLKSGFEKQKEITNIKNNPLTHSVGFLDHVEPDIFVRNVEEQDIYLLCSDGLHGMVSNQVILDVFKSEDLNSVAKMCTIKALSKGGLDNISVVVVKIVSCTNKTS